MAIKVTFHSYKGGSGRSSTALNTLPYLVEELKADAKHPILLLDTDIDSAGMTYLFDLADHFAINPDVKSFLKGDIIWRTKYVPDNNYKAHGLLSHFVPVGSHFDVEDEAVLFLGVNDKMKIDNNEIDGTTEELLRNLAIFAENNPDISAIIMDSASGAQTVANFATDFAKTLVCCMRPTMQFRQGTFRFLSNFANDHETTRVVILPTVVPSQEVVIDGVAQRARARELIENNVKRLENTASIEIDKTFLQEDCFGINEVQRFKWIEEVLYVLEKEGKLNGDDEKIAASRYKKLAKTLCK